MYASHARTPRMLVSAVAANMLAIATLGAQSLTDRVTNAPPGLVQFTFAARTDICGNGRSYIQTSPGSFTGTFIGYSTDGVRSDPCQAGPVRVVLDRADREIIAIQTYVGPVPTTTAGVTDLGRVGAQQAADFLLALAAKGEGRVGHDAIMPAMLADSTSTSDGLTAIARNSALPRETRRTALSWIGRSTDGMSTIPPRVVETLVTVARDDTDNQTVRQEAMTDLGRLEHGAGVAPLIELARQNTSMWLAKEAMTALTRSGDPRAREYLRTAAQRTDLSDDARAVAIRALGQEYATPQDAALLRAMYPTLQTERARESVLTALADIGGSENVHWLLAITGNQNEPVARRRTALSQADRAGAPIADVVALYDGSGDQQMKEALISVYARSGEKAAVDKLLWIIKNETNVNVRKYAVSQLTNSDDPRIREALKELVGKP
jgi:HEAT repeat protein